VRPLLAALIAMMLVIGITTDQVECLDGCTDEAQPEGASTATTSLCDLCHGWHRPHTLGVGAPAERPLVTLAPPASREEPAHVTPLDHPPRLADVHQNPITRLAA
jgi:hypothetical protein